MGARHENQLRRTLAERLAIAVLLLLLAWGLWQSYGGWLVGAVRQHAA